MAIDDKIGDEKFPYDINREAAKMINIHVLQVKKL